LHSEHLFSRDLVKPSEQDEGFLLGLVSRLDSAWPFPQV
jgi:hypothetical protein